MSYGKPDSNQATIVRALRAIGCVVRVLSRYHILVGYRGRWHVMEVKSGKKKLTKQESDLQAECRLRNIPYLVIYNAEEAIKEVTICAAC